MNKKGSINSKTILVILFFAYAVLNIYLLIMHEPWRDEANVWLLARELTPLSLFKELRYQGHPCLWYLLVMPLAKLHLPFVSISILSFLVMLTAAYLLVFRSPLHPLIIALFLFGPVFSYYYPVIARNYCLAALVLTLMAVMFPKRYEKPLLFGFLTGLLLQTDTIAAGAFGAVILWYLFGTRKVREGGRVLARFAVFPFLSMVLWAYTFLHVTDSPEFHVERPGLSELIGGIRYHGIHILTRMTGLPELYALILLGVLLASGIYLAVRIRNLWPVFTVLCAYLFEIAFSVFIYQLHIFHFIFLGFALLFGLWTAMEEYGKKGEDRVFLLPQIAAGALLLLLFVPFFSPKEESGLINGILGSYSDGKNMASYIRENIPEEALIIGTNVAEASTVLASLPEEYEFYYAGTLTKETYADYSERQESGISGADLLSEVRNTFENPTVFYIMDCKSTHLYDIPEGAELLYETKESTAKGEEYRLYRIGHE